MSTRKINKTVHDAFERALQGHWVEDTDGHRIRLSYEYSLDVCEDGEELALLKSDFHIDMRLLIEHGDVDSHDPLYKTLDGAVKVGKPVKNFIIHQMAILSKDSYVRQTREFDIWLAVSAEF